MLLAILIRFAVSQERDCPNMMTLYQPCKCTIEGGHQPDLTCFQADATVLTRIFNQNAVQYFRKLTIIPDSKSIEITIPHKALKDVQHVEITCPFKHFRFKVDPIDTSEKNASIPLGYPITIELTISNCDLNGLNYAFLKSLINIKQLKIISSANVHLDSSWTNALESLIPSLKTLEICHCSGISVAGLNQSRSWLESDVNIKTLSLWHNDKLDDAMMDAILKWVGISSAGSLEILDIKLNALTRIPPRISSFRSLKVLDLSGNIIPIITKGSLSFTSPITFLHIDNCSIEKIEPRAFNGNMIC